MAQLANAAAHEAELPKIEDEMTPEAYVHRVRASVFAREVEWRLSDDRLMWTDTDARGDSASGMIALDQVESVRLTREPMRGGARLFCRVKTREGATAYIGSLHYAGVLRGEDRSATYKRLVRALIARVAHDSPRALFLKGATPLVWWSSVLGLAGFAGALGVFLAAVGVFAVLAWRELFTTRLVLGLALIALGAPNLIRWLTSNRPGTFDPANPPL